MRINRYLATASGLSRRGADQMLQDGRVTVNGQPASLGQEVNPSDTVVLDGVQLQLPVQFTTIVLNKPAGYVVSRIGQGSQTVYRLLPAEYRQLKPVGRLDKDSSGLLLLTDDGHLAQQLGHPRYQKDKVYEVILNRPLRPADRQTITQGVAVEDYTSLLGLRPLGTDQTNMLITMRQGRNRQIRKTFAALGYRVQRLHRIQFGPYSLGQLASGDYQLVT